MATRYINATIGQQFKGDGYNVTAQHNSTGAAGHVSIAYDDTVVTSIAKLKAALDAILAQAKSSSFFTP